MRNAPRIARISLIIADITPKTRWSFVEVTDDCGAVGVGEASLLGREAELDAAFEPVARPLLNAHATAAASSAAPIPADIGAAAILSAIDQALWDLDAKRQQVPLARLLGAKRQDLRVYANINRRTVSRTPDAFAASARLAIERGFSAIKMAPFDEVSPANASRTTAANGLARIAAVRAAIPSAAAVYVDCHWRFTTAVAREMVRTLADVGCAWYECPIAETDEAGPELASIRSLCAAENMILAGREEGVTRAPFERYACDGAYDVMMPDVKYIGGIREMLATATMLASHGIRFSPHNHTGPIGHLASLSVALAADGCDLLEMQFDETPLFDAIVTGDMPKPMAGRLIAPASPGLGCALNHAVLQSHISVLRTVST